MQKRRFMESRFHKAPSFYIAHIKFCNRSLSLPSTLKLVAITIPVYQVEIKMRQRQYE